MGFYVGGKIGPFGYSKSLSGGGRRASSSSSGVPLAPWAEALGTSSVIMGSTALLSGVWFGGVAMAICCTLAGLLCLGIMWEHLPRSAARKYKIEVKEAERRILYAQKMARAEAKRTARVTEVRTRKAQAEADARARLKARGKL